MKKIYLLTILTFLACNLYSQKKDSLSILDRLLRDSKMLNVMLDMRVDYRAEMNKDKLENSSFQGHTFKLWFEGEIIPGIRYRVRHRLNKPQVPLREGYSAATDHAYLAFDIGKHWTITAGKQTVQFGTFEFDYNPADVYMQTMCFNDLDAYKTGVNIAYKFMNQVINLQAVNSDSPHFASEKYKNKAIAINALWEGNFFNGGFKTRWAYGAFQHKKDKFYSWYTIGNQINIRKFTAEIDYYMGNQWMDYSSIVNDLSLESRYVRDQSASVNLKFNFGKWKPSIKGIFDQRFDKDFDKSAYENYGIQGLLEYCPFDGRARDLNFHLMYSYVGTNFKGNYASLDNYGINTVLVGIRWFFKVK